MWILAHNCSKTIFSKEFGTKTFSSKNIILINHQPINQKFQKLVGEVALKKSTKQQKNKENNCKSKLSFCQLRVTHLLISLISFKTFFHLTAKSNFLLIHIWPRLKPVRNREQLFKNLQISHWQLNNKGWKKGSPCLFPFWGSTNSSFSPLLRWEETTVLPPFFFVISSFPFFWKWVDVYFNGFLYNWV